MKGRERLVKHIRTEEDKCAFSFIHSLSHSTHLLILCYKYLSRIYVLALFLMLETQQWARGSCQSLHFNGGDNDKQQ